LIKFLDLQSQYAAIAPEMDVAIAQVVRNASFVGGKHVAAFEEKFGHYQQVDHVVGVGNGTDALEIALQALDLPPGVEVIVPANSFIATSEAVSSRGLRVVFADVDPHTYLLDLEDLRRKQTERTAAVIVVHLYGQPQDVQAVREVLAPGVRIIEDCAQAHGAEVGGRRVGGLADVGAFSFYPGKNLGAYGDAGAITTNDPDVAARCRMIANHGRREKYLHEFEGRNSRLDALQAAVLSVKLDHLDTWLDQRIEVAGVYAEALGDLPGLVLPTAAPSSRHVFHLYVVQCEDRDGLGRFLDEHDVQTGVHYPVCLPDQPAYAEWRDETDCQVARQLAARVLSLPMGEHLTHGDVLEVASLVRTFHGGGDQVPTMRAAR
jgi:dTDP-4-amino-4,6-dideoxygalactose transaminase